MIAPLENSCLVHVAELHRVAAGLASVLEFPGFKEVCHGIFTVGANHLLASRISDKPAFAVIGGYFNPRHLAFVAHHRLG